MNTMGFERSIDRWPTRRASPDCASREPYGVYMDDGMIDQARDGVTVEETSLTL